MENKHTLKLPMKISEKNECSICDIDGNFIIETFETETAEFIVTACNNYQALKEENEEYRDMLELIRDCYKTDAKGALDRGNTTKFNYYSNQATHINNLLTKHSK